MIKQKFNKNEIDMLQMILEDGYYQDLLNV